jgi:hypothetical protein
MSKNIKAKAAISMTDVGNSRPNSCFGTLLDTTQSIYTRTEYADVFDADFLLEPDEKFTAKKFLEHI